MVDTIKAGAKIRNVRSENSEYGWHGTFGCLVRSRAVPSDLFILSAAHVVALNGYAEPGDVIEAEYPAGTGRWTEIGRFERAYRWYDADGVQQLCDAALTRVTNAARISAEIEGIGAIKQVSTNLYEGMRLKFRGAGTGDVAFAKLLTFGAGTMALYRDFSNGSLFQLEYADQILYVQENSAIPTSPTMPMDSGALVLTEDNQAIGMHFARTPHDYPVNAAVCTPLQTILSALDVELVTGQMETPPADAAQPASLDDIGVHAYEAFDVLLRLQMEPHTMYGGASWYLSREGLIADNKLDRSPGRLVTVPRVWNQYGDLIVRAAITYRVPVELIVATICTESSGQAGSVRTEPKWVSDTQTPDQVSAGLMQTLISTARWMLPHETIDRTTLCNPQISISAGTAYLSHQRHLTGFDPPVVACAYNAGQIALNDSASNRWRMRQYPIGSASHADRFVQWFNDCFIYLASNPVLLPQQTVSLAQLMRG